MKFFSKTASRSASRTKQFSAGTESASGPDAVIVYLTGIDTPNERSAGGR